jgi:hypothetical protein
MSKNENMKLALDKLENKHEELMNTLSDEGSTTEEIKLSKIEYILEYENFLIEFAGYSAKDFE